MTTKSASLHVNKYEIDRFPLIVGKHLLRIPTDLPSFDVSTNVLISISDPLKDPLQRGVVYYKDDELLDIIFDADSPEFPSSIRIDIIRNRALPVRTPFNAVNPTLILGCRKSGKTNLAVSLSVELSSRAPAKPILLLSPSPRASDAHVKLLEQHCPVRYGPTSLTSCTIRTAIHQHPSYSRLISTTDAELLERMTAEILATSKFICTTYDQVHALTSISFSTILMDDNHLCNFPLENLSHSSLIVFGDPFIYQFHTTPTLFNEVFKTGVRVRVLPKQYFCHPKLFEFQSKHFYGSLISSHPRSRNVLTNSVTWPSPNVPLMFVDVTGAECATPPSFANDAEARAVAHICSHLRARNAEPSRITIVSPYAPQLANIQNAMSRVSSLPPSFCKAIAFQTLALDITAEPYVIVSLVRSNLTRKLGILADYRVLNLILSCAPHSLILVGDSKTLCCDPHWAALLLHLDINRTVVRLESAIHRRASATGTPAADAAELYAMASVSFTLRGHEIAEKLDLDPDAEDSTIAMTDALLIQEHVVDEDLDPQGDDDDANLLLNLYPKRRKNLVSPIVSIEAPPAPIEPPPLADRFNYDSHLHATSWGPSDRNDGPRRSPGAIIVPLF